MGRFHPISRDVATAWPSVSLGTRVHYCLVRKQRAHGSPRCVELHRRRVMRHATAAALIKTASAGQKGENWCIGIPRAVPLP